MVKTYKSKKVILLFIVLISFGCASLQAQTKRTTRTKTKTKQKTYINKTQTEPIEQKVIVIHDTVIQQQPIKKDTSVVKEVVANDKIKEQPMNNTQYNQSQSSWFMEFNPIFYTGSNSPKPAFTIAGGYTGSVSKYVALGFGIGLMESFEFKGKPSIPIFGRMEFDDKSKEVSPFAILDMGYGINFEDFSYGSIIINPTIGARFNNIYIGGGYTAFISTNSEGGTTNCINLKLGYKFGNNNLSFKKFFQKTYFDMEIGTGIGTNSYDLYFPSNYGKTKENIKIKYNEFVNFTYNYKINNNLIVGLGSGIHISYQTSDDYYYSYKNGSHTDYPVNGSIYLRCKYILFEDIIKFRPFVCLDIGSYLSYFDAHPFVFNGRIYPFIYNCAFIEPQIGIKFNKISLGLGYLYIKSDCMDMADYYRNNEKQKISFFNVRLGFTL